MRRRTTGRTRRCITASSADVGWACSTASSRRWRAKDRGPCADGRRCGRCSRERNVEFVERRAHVPAAPTLWQPPYCRRSMTLSTLPTSLPMPDLETCRPRSLYSAARRGILPDRARRMLGTYTAWPRECRLQRHQSPVARPVQCHNRRGLSRWRHAGVGHEAIHEMACSVGAWCSKVRHDAHMVRAGERALTDAAAGGDRQM